MPDIIMLNRFRFVTDSSILVTWCHTISRANLSVWLLVDVVTTCECTIFFVESLVFNSSLQCVWLPSLPSGTYVISASRRGRVSVMKESKELASVLFRFIKLGEVPSGLLWHRLLFFIDFKWNTNKTLQYWSIHGMWELKGFGIKRKMCWLTLRRILWRKLKKR